MDTPQNPPLDSPNKTDLINDLFHLVLKYCYINIFINPCVHLGNGKSARNVYYIDGTLSKYETKMELIHSSLDSRDISPIVDNIISGFNTDSDGSLVMDIYDKIPSYLLKLYSRTSYGKQSAAQNINGTILQLYNVVDFAYNPTFINRKNYNIFFIKPFSCVDCDFKSDDVVSLSDASLFGSTIVENDDSFIIDKTTWNQCPPFLRLFVLYTTIFNNIEEFAKTTNNLLPLSYINEKLHVLYYGNSLFKSTTSYNSDITRDSNFLPDYLQCQFSDYPYRYDVLYIIRNSALIQKYAYVKNLYNIVQNRNCANQSMFNSTNGIDEPTVIRLESIVSLEDDTTEDTDQGSNPDIGVDTASSDDTTDDEDDQDTTGIPTIDDGNSNSKSKDYFFRYAVAVLNNRLQNMPSPPLSPQELAYLNDWCDLYLWNYSVDDTKAILKKFNLAAYFKIFN